MKTTIISEEQKAKRQYWINEISRLSGNFGVDAEKLEQEIGKEIKDNGIDALLGHLRLCGAIPERYGHDTSEEKLYSKYTDVVIHEAFKGELSCTRLKLLIVNYSPASKPLLFIVHCLGSRKDCSFNILAV